MTQADGFPLAPGENSYDDVAGDQMWAVCPTSSGLRVTVIGA